MARRVETSKHCSGLQAQHNTGSKAQRSVSLERRSARARSRSAFSSAASAARRACRWMAVAVVGWDACSASRSHPAGPVILLPKSQPIAYSSLSSCMQLAAPSHLASCLWCHAGGGDSWHAARRARRSALSACRLPARCSLDSHPGRAGRCAALARSSARGGGSGGGGPLGPSAGQDFQGPEDGVHALEGLVGEEQGMFSSYNFIRVGDLGGSAC